MCLLAAEAVVEADTDRVDYRAVAGVDGHTVDVLAAATSVEVLHTFTLIHDDIMDGDDLRRGVPAVHEVYGRPQAILAGDTLFATAFELLGETGAPPERSVRATSEFATTCTQVCEGQALDLAFETRDGVDHTEYLEMAGDKTAALYALAMSLPAILLGADDAVEPLAAYGRNVGRAFQVQDDLLDLTTPSERLGKQRGSDLVEDKVTLVTAHARDHGVDVDGLVEADTAAAIEESAVEAAVAELEAAGSIEYARQTATELVASAKASLAALPDSEARRRLTALAEYAVERDA
jgi:geranylgeranyl diphosphate synthase type I